jgi:hypothetical protein
MVGDEEVCAQDRLSDIGNIEVLVGIVRVLHDRMGEPLAAVRETEERRCFLSSADAGNTHTSASVSTR